MTTISANSAIAATTQTIQRISVLLPGKCRFPRRVPGMGQQRKAFDRARALLVREAPDEDFHTRRIEHGTGVADAHASGRETHVDAAPILGVLQADDVPL